MCVCGGWGGGVGGSLSDWACFLLKSTYLNSLALEILVPGENRWQTSLLIASIVSVGGGPLVPSLDSDVMVSSEVSLKIFHQVTFPLFAKLPVTSLPLMA